ncbi:alpha/beta fold hydrolase [Janibacter sp. GXQ6167]|uniref:alpha/beta fold hydrolase n=1 Tax=Janibacter sp. GXQ6167 TaxID=3240791 RepID=UPI0035236652
MNRHPRRRLLTVVAAAPIAALALGTIPAMAGPAAPAATPAATPAAAPAAQAAKNKTPNIRQLAGALARQKLTWEKCDYKDAGLNQRFANIPNIKCATVKVPRDWHDAKNGKTWDVKISHATNQSVTSGRYKGTIFVNPGGPGGSGLPWAAAMQQRTPDLRPYYNYVGFDPRGVGQSSAPKCTFTYDANSKDPYARDKAIGKTCASDPDVRTINTEQTVYDMDLIRHLLKAPKLDYIGYSYGTWLGAWYENVFSANAGRFLLDSATDVTKPTLQRTWELQPKARDRQFQMHLMNWIARNNDTYGLGTDAQKIYDRYFAATKEMSSFVVLLTWYFSGGLPAFPDNSQYPAAGSVVKSLIESGERSGAAKKSTADSTADPAVEVKTALKKVKKGPKLSKDTLTSINEGISQMDALTSIEEEDAPTGKAAAMRTETFDSTFEMIRCGDGQWTQRTGFWENWVKKIERTAPFTTQLGGATVPVCAFWQTNNMMPAADQSFPDTIVLQGELDSQTAWETGFTSATKLPNTSALFIDNEGSHGHFPYGTECVDAPIYKYFLNGKMPKNIKVCQGLPLPWETTTYETWGKLNAAGRHVPANPSPWTPAGSAGKRLGQKMDLAPADTETQEMVRSVVQETYGTDGVKLLEREGALD